MTVVEEVVRYNYRLRPGAQAEAHLLAEWGRVRWVWNECVGQQRAGGDHDDLVVRPSEGSHARRSHLPDRERSR